MAINRNRDKLTALGNRIKEIRKKLNISQKDFANSLSMANSYLSEIENGRANPSFEFFYRLSTLYNVNLNYLFHGIDDMFMPREIDKKKSGNQKEWRDDIESVHDLYWFMENSTIVKDTIMGFAAKFFYQNEDIIKRNIKKHREKQDENKQ